MYPCIRWIASSKTGQTFAISYWTYAWFMVFSHKSNIEPITLFEARSHRIQSGIQTQDLSILRHPLAYLRYRALVENIYYYNNILQVGILNYFLFIVQKWYSTLLCSVPSFVLTCWAFKPHFDQSYSYYNSSELIL